jgi:hypothetical protein
VTEFEISDPDLMPRQLAQAATALHCSYADGIKTRPTRFIRINNSAFALVFCPALLGTDRIFDIQNPRKPILMQVAFFAVDSGFGTTSGPGIVTTWKKGTDIFEAVIGSDLCPSSRLRHVYRFGANAGRGSDGFGLFLTRIDVQKDGCGNGEWTPLWNAPAWPKAEDLR